MRITKERIRHIAITVASRLQDQGLLEVTGSEETLIQALDKAIRDELSVEDRLNAEVRNLLQQYQAEFEKGQADYQKMFTMIKSKLVKERDLVL